MTPTYQTPMTGATSLQAPIDHPPGLERLHGACEAQVLRPDLEQAVQDDDGRDRVPAEFKRAEGCQQGFQLSKQATSSARALSDRAGETVPAMARVQEDEGEAAFRHRKTSLNQVTQEVHPLRPAQSRRIISSLRRFELVWTELGKGLGPDATDYLPVLKSRVLHDLQHPNKQKLAVHQEVFNMSASRLKTVAEVLCPNHFAPRAHRHGLNGGKAFDLVLRHDLAKPAAQNAVLSYLKHHWPGLCVVCPPCGPFSQLNNLHKHLRERDLGAMKRYLKKNVAGKKLLAFAMKVCQLRYDLGIVFLFEHPWGATSWNAACVRRLLRLPGVSIAQVTMNTNVGRQDGEAKSSRAQTYPSKLIDAILSEYARSACVEAHCIRVVDSQDAVERDRRHDTFYFTDSEQSEIQLALQQEVLECSTSAQAQEVWHQEDDPEPVPDPSPGAAGLSKDQVDSPGSYEISNGRLALVVHDCDRVPLPEDGSDVFHWRTTYSRSQGLWTVVEHEIRRRDLHQRSPKVRRSEVLVSIYSRHLGEHQARRLRHFPGLQQVGLERLVRRAHDGLGHLETERFIRILKHGSVPNEVIEIARNL